MASIYHILIIEDHPITARAYKAIVENIPKNKLDKRLALNMAFTIDQALDQLRANTEFDLILLDINLAPSSRETITSGEILGRHIRNQYPNTKIIVITMLSNPKRIASIIKTMYPDGFLVKTDIDENTLVDTVLKVKNGNTYYSKSVNVKSFNTQAFELNALDIKILVELGNGAKMKELMQLIPLSKSGIERRKRLLKQQFNCKTDRDLVITARKKGVI